VKVEREYCEEATLEHLHQICFSKGIPFASFHEPRSERITTFIQHSKQPHILTSLSALDSVEGFVASPFSQTGPTYVIEPNMVHTSHKTVKEILHTLSEVTASDGVEPLPAESLYEATKQEFEDQVRAMQAEITKGNITKAVLSRIKLQPRRPTEEITTIFCSLADAYPDAFVYVFNIPEVGCWMGASPEPLLTVMDNVAETISLAGTQSMDNRRMSQVTWQGKELKEQGIVTSYIEDVLNNFGITEYRKEGPSTHRAGNLVHLKTSFQFNAAQLKNRIGLLVEALQPTPSVCGLPKVAARAIVEKVEPHNRQFYTGFVGPVNFNGKTLLYVNLRCMKITENAFAFFMGAGITAESIPEREWEETGQKMMTLLSVVNGINSSYELNKTGN